MLLAFVSVSFFIGLFMTFIWSSSGFANCLIKSAFAIYALWCAALLLGLLWPYINNGTMKLF